MNEKPFVFILVGPTGVGKTTTIAKLAAMYALGTPKRRPFEVRILTIDNYRIGARQQMEIYGDIMGIPVTCVESREDFEKQLAVYADVDVIFIDTIGKSPRDYAKLGEMRELLASCGRTAHTHLAMSATTKPSDMEDVMQQFEPFGYESIIATKVDETQRVGGLISLLHRKGKGVSFLTDGQRVPQDIEPATVMRFLRNLEGFRIDREQLEQRFALREGE
jgi:flagellar biosynthesis protein FlhF